MVSWLAPPSPTKEDGASDVTQPQSPRPDSEKCPPEEVEVSVQQPMQEHPEPRRSSRQRKQPDRFNAYGNHSRRVNSEKGSDVASTVYGHDSY